MKILMTLMLVAAIAFMAAGQTDEEWEALSERLSIDGWMFLDIGNAIVDRIELLEDYVFSLHPPAGIITLSCTAYGDESKPSTSGVAFVPDTPYVLYEEPILDTVEALYIEERESDLTEKPDTLAVFILGAAVGIFIVLVCGG